MNENSEFALDTENLKNIPLHKYTSDFTFLVDGKEYKTNRFIADILSPIIREYHFTDETINEFSIKINNENDDNNIDYFQDFLNLSSFNKSKIDLHRKRFYSKCFLKLGNIEEYFRILPEYSEEITIDNAIDILNQIFLISTKITNDENLQLKYKITKNIEQLISFISKNFDFIDKNKIKELDIELIEEIISSQSLQLKEEDSLLKFLIDLYEEDSKFSPLFEYVLFSNVQEDTFGLFITSISLSDINKSVWESIRKRFISSELNTSDNKNSRYLQTTQNIQFDYQKGKEREGILKYLTNDTKENINDNGTIEITSNSILDPKKYHPKNLIEFDKNNGYASKDDGDAFVCFDFKDKSIQLSSYSIQSNSSGENYHHLKNWVVEVSNDNINWLEIDRHENCPRLNGQNIISNFEVRNDNKDYYRFVKIRQTGNSWAFWGNHNSLFFYSIEFFGKLKLII